jgi:hypothetical protein
VRPSSSRAGKFRTATSSTSCGSPPR